MTIDHKAQPRQGYTPVTVDMRALVDKVLARYSAKFSVFRELLQNSDDARCDSAEIRFESAAFSPLDAEAMMDDLDTTHVVRWTFRNHGKPFRPQDWQRLPRIALGNPDRTKIGAFGVGFFSVFSITENPCVSSGDKEMEFQWDKENQLRYRFDDRPKTETRDLWTTFKIPLREAAPMPPIAELMQFLASSITFMVCLEKVAVFFDGRRVGQITKSLGQSQPIPIPNELGRSSLEHIMTVKSVEKQRKVTLPQRDLHERKNVTVFTAEVDVAVDAKFSKELNRCMKKKPPSDLKYRLTYTGKDEHEQSHKSEQNHQFPSPFQGLCADLDGAMDTRVYIASLTGHATAQTTGIGGHMASHFIPTVERESIDLADINVGTWNRELLYVGGILCRAVYELELSEIQDSWKGAAANEPDLRRGLQDQLHKRFLHVLKFFTFHRSTPSSTVAELLADSFYGCSTLPLRLLSSVGVRGAPHVREFNSVLAKFLKSVPMLSEHVTQFGARSIAALPDKHKISAITPSDILEDLRGHTLDTEELVAFLRWWMNSARDELAADLVDQLLSTPTLRGNTGEEICLSSVTSFIDPKVLGPHIPSDGPLPLSLIPIGVSWHFDFKELVSLRLKEFTVASWLRHLSDPDVVSADEEYDFTRSTDWARSVLSTLSRVWLQLPEDIRHESRKAFQNKPCIPTSKGLCYPECSYLPITDGTQFEHLDLPIVSWDSGFEVNTDMGRCLLSLGVRKDPPVHFLLDQMRPRGNWTVLDLIKYLVQEERSLTDDDISGLKLIKIFTKEDSEDSSEENIGCCADELFPPVDTFRKLQLPIIEWSEKLEWRDTSSEARLLYRLGLNHFPSLPKIVELCSSEEEEVQETAFTYLCKELETQYSAYKPEDFQDVEFIPAEINGRTYLKKLGEVYSGTQWKALGFFVVPQRYMKMPLARLGVTQQPPTSKISDLLENTPPRDGQTARHWFEVLSDRISDFSSSDRNKLSGLPFVPMGASSALKFLPPSKCYLDKGSKPKLYAKLFVFVNFGDRANDFLRACGLKNQVVIEDVAEVLIENPQQFFDFAGGYDDFLVELRKIAYQRRDISNHTLHKMSEKHALLGVRRQKAEDQDKWHYDYKFLTSQEVTIVDDGDDYQLFSDRLFVAPQEEVLESFYASLGCSYLSAVVKERFWGLHEIQATEICLEVQSRILQRLPLFIQKYTDTKPKVKIPSIPDDLKVKACKKIRVFKTLVTATGEVERWRDVRAIARHEGDCIELWIAKTAKRDIVATSLCRLLFGTNKTNATLLLEKVLSADREGLERRGFLVDQVPQEHRGAYRRKNKARQKHVVRSTSTTNYLRPPTLDTQPDPQLNSETLPGSYEATVQSPSHLYADGVLVKADEALTNVSGDNTLDIVEQPTSIPLSRTSREVIPQKDIRNNAEAAINACGQEREKSAIHAGARQFSSNSFCRLSADVKGLRPLDPVNGIQVYVHEDMPGTDTFMARKQDPLARFADIISTLCKVYNIHKKTLCIFNDVSGGCIAFNYKRVIYLNLRYFEAWHDKQVESGNRQDALMFLAFAHEIAHNEIDQHNADHEFLYSAICEARLVEFSQLLRPVIVVLFAYIATRMAPAAKILY
ncbi:hypothetical protein L210DRAFT_3651207 [Boletus edulis BED1]|uniref:Sacsin/Nov domain-containing protein n=1 Tax=Boletus edulis BED1 TaxID=1328754 RepID=A0AAD4G9G3_BOLED|nr:hypothetical protein L210DRAFT_3651207 [Boletus edulis BED1]